MWTRSLTIIQFQENLPKLQTIWASWKRGDKIWKNVKTPDFPGREGGLLRISSDEDDRMGAKIKPPKKCHAEFPSHKNFQRKYRPGWQGTISNIQIVLNTPKKSLLQSSYPKLYLPKFSYPPPPKKKILTPQKSFDHPCHSKSGAPPWAGITPQKCSNKVFTFKMNPWKMFKIVSMHFLSSTRPRKLNCNLSCF